jgi:Fic family protein
MKNEKQSRFNRLAKETTRGDAASLTPCAASAAEEHTANLLPRLRSEKTARLKGGLYHETQIALCYNSNRIEGNRLSEQQTRLIFETATLLPENGDAIRMDDLIETSNHFAAFDFLLDVADRPLDERCIKQFHAVLKRGTTDAAKEWFRVGGYKRMPNMVGGRETTPPRKVACAMKTLLAEYRALPSVTFEAVIDFHYRFETIHPFQDGNGRVGRLIAFKECLAHGLVPFIIDESHKAFYYRGLSRYPETPEYLLDTCRSAQDRYAEMIRYFAARLTSCAATDTESRKETEQ